MFWALVLVLSLAVILLAAELFTNGVEWVGYRLNLGEGVVGSVLAAVGTAMPETLIPIVAILFFGEASANEVGIGAILGAPFMLSTLAMFVVGTTVLVFSRDGRRTTRVDANASVLSRDIVYFLAFYGAAVMAGFVAIQWLKWLIAVALLIGYALYVFRHFKDQAEECDEPKPLHASVWLPRAHCRVSGRVPNTVLDYYFAEYSLIAVGASGQQCAGVAGGKSLAAITPLYFLDQGTPRLGMCIGQTVGALVLMVIGAHFFVQSVDHISVSLGIPALVLALIIAPVATELPEKFNSVLWVRAGKDTLAMGNITGAMTFQSCIPTAIGMSFTHWALAGSVPALLSAVIALITTAVIFGIGRLRGYLTAPLLLVGGVFYAAYLGYLFLFVI